MLYMIRHAQSVFNFEADKQLKETMGPEFSKTTEKYIEMKFDLKYVDCGLTEQGRQQCLKPRELMQNIQIDLVLVSPMKRALETCDIIFKDHKCKPPIIVEPGVREIFRSSCDIGGRLRESMEELSYFDYSKIANPDIWYIETLKNEQVKESILSELEGVGAQNLREAGAKAMLEYIRKNNEQTDLYHLSDIAGQKQRIRDLSTKYKNIAIVSHYQNIHVYSKMAPKNAEIVQLSVSDL